MANPISASVDAAFVKRNLANSNENLELQSSICMDDEYARFPNRAFKKARTGPRYGPYFLDTEQSDGLKLRHGQTFRCPPEAHRLYILNKIKGPLKTILDEEAMLLRECGSSIRRRPPLENDRHICDSCLTSIFNLHWMCSVCGLDICIDCYRKDWTAEPNRHIGKCSHRRLHLRGHMLPVVKFDLTSIDNILVQCSESIIGSDQLTEPPMLAAIHCGNGAKQETHPSMTCTPAISHLPKSPIPSTTPQAPLLQPLDAYSMKSENEDPCFHFDIVTLMAKHASLESFQEQWQDGKPVIIHGVMGNSKADWTPSYFSKNYGDQVIDAIDCSDGTIQAILIKDFFNGFSDPRKRSGYRKSTGKSKILKIKDWPPKTDFSTQFPALYTDFMEMLPLPEYCKSTGYFNLSNRLPSEYVRPDLGPKMFIAYGSVHGEEGVGTTKLHCDMADAINIMCYAEKADNMPAAVWDIYRYEDMPALRAFVTKIANEQRKWVIDPIHSQWLYLNDKLRTRLFEEYGVKSWRVHQNPGDAVFIPAGCAHQVSNYHSAIKCAYDFLSPENLGRCHDLTHQFSHVHREDVLQLKNTLLFAWKSIFEL